MSSQSLLRQTVEIAQPSTTRDKQGRLVESNDSTSYQARVEKTSRIITTAEKDREPIDAIVFLNSSAEVTKGAKLTYDGGEYRVMKVEEVPGRNGQVHHYELMVQEWSYS